MRNYPTVELFQYLLVFGRLMSFFLILPGFAQANVPSRYRLLVSVGLCLVLTPMIPINVSQPMTQLSGIAFILLQEMAIGLFLALIIKVLFAIVDIWGNFVSHCNGLSSSSLFNPAYNQHSDLISVYFSVSVTTLIFVTDTHHILIYTFFKSYKYFPVQTIPQWQDATNLLTYAFQESFLNALKLASPFFLLNLILQTVMGLLTRFAGRIQIFSISLPLQILASHSLLYIVIYKSLSTFVQVVHNNLSTILP